MYLYKYFIIFLRFFIHFKLVLLNDQINVGTVLFTKRDSEKKCWNNEQIALLRARLIYQDILPKNTLIELENDEFLNALINYFHLAINKVKRLADGPTKRINLMAMCDVLGGYFHSILIPLTKQAFYSGTINYGATQDVFKFYNDIKKYLNTNGDNWAPPNELIMSRFTRDSALIQKLNNTNNDGNSCDHLSYENNNGFIYIPAPYFVSKIAPSTIVIPFKENPLRNIKHKNAISCLSNFYLTAKNCLEEKHASDENIQIFNSEFEKFLDNEVYPHLNDETIYPAFGGVFQIKNELKRKNVKKRKNYKERDAEENAAEEKATTEENAAENSPEDISENKYEIIEDDEKAPIIVLICLCLVTLLWLCITLYYCVKNRKKTLTTKTTNDTSQLKKTNDSGKKLKEEETDCPPSTTSAEKTPRSSKKDKKEIKFTADKRENVKKKRCVVCAKNSSYRSTKICPNCKKKHCRCVNNIWSTLSNYTITFPRIFPKKSTATSGLLQKHLDISGNQTVVSLCPQCKLAKCKHLNAFDDKSDHNSKAKNHFLEQMASVIPKPPAKTIQSAPVTAGKNIWQSEYNTKTITSNVTTEQRKSDERIFVFGYDFETSSSDDSSYTDESSSDTI